MLKKLSFLGVAGTLAAAAFVTAPSAQAASRDGSCQSGEFCLYYNSNQSGSVSDFTSSVSDYGSTQPSCYVFKGPGTGKGKCVKNNAASVWNRTSKPVTVYYNSGYAGTSQTVAAGSRANLRTGLKNQNASHRIGSAPSTSSRLSFGLYKLNGGRITCGFDGYTSTPGRHEGIDIARGIGSPVRALVAGKVVNISRGYAGGGGLSTIAVYNASLGKTVIYLHSKPLDSLREGQTVSRGQQIATESYRGISSSSAAHTHVEMRPGYHELAAKSVGDYHLDNPNPYPFWRSQGYSIG